VKRSRLLVLGTLLFALAVPGCRKSTTAEAEKSEGSSTEMTGAAREARDAALAEVAKHCLKGADGWTTAVVSGSPYAPEHFVRQFRNVVVAGVQSFDLAESDRLNGFEWVGEVVFDQTPAREAGESGIVLDGVANVNVTRRPGQWSQWVDYVPSAMRVQKLKGKWQVNQDNTICRGTLPTPADFARAGVK